MYMITPVIKVIEFPPWDGKNNMEVIGCNITITNGGAWSIEFQTNGGYFDTKKKSLETRSEASKYPPECSQCIGLRQMNYANDLPH